MFLLRCRRFSRTFPLAAHGGSECQAQTSAACVSPPGLGEEPIPAPPGTSPSCPHQQTPVRPPEMKIRTAQVQLLDQKSRLLESSKLFYFAFILSQFSFQLDFSYNLPIDNYINSVLFLKRVQLACFSRQSKPKKNWSETGFELDVTMLMQFEVVFIFPYSTKKKRKNPLHLLMQLLVFQSYNLCFDASKKQTTK